MRKVSSIFKIFTAYTWEDWNFSKSNLNLPAKPSWIEGFVGQHCLSCEDG
jgi:hypothetical protein